MKTHAQLGSDAIEQAETDAEKPVAFPVAGQGNCALAPRKVGWQRLPDGPAGESIPVAARLMAVADVFDALISARVYKPPMPFVHARDLIAAERDRHFDPDVVDAFLAGFQEFTAVAERYWEEA
jgi:putative two-component system response regulator